MNIIDRINTSSTEETIDRQLDEIGDMSEVDSMIYEDKIQRTIKKDLSLKDTFMFLLWFVISVFVFFSVVTTLVLVYVIVSSVIVVV